MLNTIFSEIKTYALSEAPEDMAREARGFARAHGVRFLYVTYFPEAAIIQFNMSIAIDDLLTSGVRIASFHIPDVSFCMREMARVANCYDISEADRHSYIQALFTIYSLILPKRFDEPHTLIIAPQREGAIIAERFGFLNGSYASVAPTFKRIVSKKGLLIGHDLISSEVRPFSHVKIIDGAISSGSTIMAIILGLKDTLSSVQVYTAHACPLGLGNILALAKALNIPCTISAGDVSGELNPNYRAVKPNNPQQSVVGDIGDMICPIKDRIRYIHETCVSA